jgi:hypothetical protein
VADGLESGGVLHAAVGQTKVEEGISVSSVTVFQHFFKTLYGLFILRRGMGTTMGSLRANCILHFPKD